MGGRGSVFLRKQVIPYNNPDAEEIVWREIARFAEVKPAVLQLPEGFQRRPVVYL